jgi:hypothetical protein
MGRTIPSYRIATEPDTRRECPHCIQYNFHVKLQGRKLKPGEQKPSDYDQFLQCHSCGNIVPAHEGILESKIQDSLETIETPFESKFEVTGIAKRITKEGKLTSARKRREKQRPHHKDKEIDEEMRRHGSENVHIIQDTN